MSLKYNFGEYLCDDKVLKKYMEIKYFDTYKKLKDRGDSLDVETAKEIAKAVKAWAFEMGASHYTHWFLPLTNKSAEKQVSFIELKNGKIIEDFDEKALIKSEADASSFPNGGSRLTFEARGYSIWDYTSPIFIRSNSNGDKVVYIPTAFCSYSGIALDEKTPLLRALETLNKESVRMLHLLGYNEVKKVNLMIGAEQEYFLIKKDVYEKRFDLKTVGRVLLGANPIKNQEEHYHYFGMIDDDVSVIMNEIDRELWSIGITAKLQHNEVAPRQYELVPIYTNANIANDQNQMIMDVISRVAKKHDYVAIFNEKPFGFSNGSGKHLNWSLETDTDLNLFDIRNDKNIFYTFYTAMVMAVDSFHDLINLSTSYYSNEFRLGGPEAPPKIVSLFVSDYILDYVEKMNSDSDNNESTKYLKTGVKSIAEIKKDFCDRNRTSPFAFSGNKFEFRMVGSSQTVAWPTTCLCVSLANAIKTIADTYENNKNLINILSDFNEQHKRIIFNGDSYSTEWLNEAEQRKLLINKSTYEFYDELCSDKIVSLFENTNVLNKEELELRKNTLKSNYYKSLMLDAKTMSYMLIKYILPTLYTCKESCPYLNIADKTEVLKSKSNELYEKINIKNDEQHYVGVMRDLKELMNEIRDIYNNIEAILPYRFEFLPNINEILE